MLENFFPKYMTSKNIIFFIITILFLVIIAKIFDIAILFFASFVIACSLEPLVKKLTGRFSRNTACSIVLFGLIFLIIAFFVPIIKIGGHEIKAFILSFPLYADSIKEFVYSIPFINKEAFTNMDTNILSSVSTAASKLVEETVVAGKHIGVAIVYSIVSILIIYYFMVDRDKVKATILRLFPVSLRKKTGEVFSSIAERTGGYLIAQVVTMASVGVVVTIGLFLLRSEYALLLGIMTALFDIVPVVGPMIAFVICLVVMYKSGFVVMALTALIFLIAQFVENNFVRPYVFSKFLNLHPLIIYLFIFIAAKYFGILGVVFAPAIAATIVVLIEEVYMKSLE